MHLNQLRDRWDYFAADAESNEVQLEYLDVTVLRRGVGEVRVVAGRAPACWQVWRGMQYKEECFYNWTWDVCSHWKQTND
jgi:hypothetical protein